MCSTGNTCLDETRQRTAEQIMTEREDMICAIEMFAKEVKSNSAQMPMSADVARITAEANLALMEALAKRAKYHDIAAIDLMRDGAPIVGKLERFLSQL